MMRQRQELDDTLKATASVEAEMERLHGLEEQMKLLRDQEDRLLDDKRQSLATAWRDLLQPAIHRRMGELQRELDAQLVVVEKIGELRARLRDLERIGESERCPTCEQTLTNAHPVNLESEKNKIKEALDEHKFDEGRLTELSQSIGKLRKVTGSGSVGAIKRIEEQLMDIRIQMSDQERLRDEVAERLKGHDEAAVARNRRLHESLTKELGVLENAIKEKGEAIDRWQAEALRNRSAISKVSGPHLERLNREVELYDQLIALFRQGVASLRDELRESVERCL